MRIKINFSKNTEPLMINNQELLNSYIHKCLGANNEYHDAKSNYSISMLCGGKLNNDKKTLSFKNGGYIIVSSFDEVFINKLISGILTNINFTHGMKFKGIEPIEEKLVNGWNHFSTLSPILLKSNDKKEFITITQSDFSKKMEKHIKNKVQKINPDLDVSDLKININDHPNHKTKAIKVKNILNIASKCNISIFTNKKVATLLYSIGLGQSTGSGFGAIIKTENFDFYKW